MRKEKNHHSLAYEGKILPNTYLKKKRSSNIANVKSLILKVNPVTQRYVANKSNCFISSINKSIQNYIK